VQGLYGEVWDNLTTEQKRLRRKGEGGEMEKSKIK